MSHKRPPSKEGGMGERGGEYLLPGVGGPKVDQAEAKQPPSRWWWYGFGDSQGVATDERERQVEVAKTTRWAMDNVVGRQEVVIIRDNRGVTKKFPNPSVNNFTKENFVRAAGAAKTKQGCRNSLVHSNTSGKRDKLKGTALQNCPKPPNKLRKTKTQAAINKNLREVRKTSVKQHRETTTTGRATNVAEVDELTAGWSRPSVAPEAASAGAPGGQTLNPKVAVALLLVFHMVLVQLFGYFWLSVAATN